MNLKRPEGTLEIITGPMFSGKTEELLKRLKILEIAEVNTIVFKPSFDVRFDENKIVSRTGAKTNAIVIKESSEILKYWNSGFKAVAIDEVNFLDDGIFKVIDKLVLNGVRVIISGLDMDYLRRPFGVTPGLLAIADDITKLKAVCLLCKSDAAFSFRKENNNDLNFLGDSEYEARCRKCHILGENNKLKISKNK
ncbi:thymidine kinase [Mycoplasmopsis felis]|uniref:thymidine kinase n=1 Tax=Mycoplasmopsis felis TaxID=33923 RepID=UPI0021DF6C14|nr:thymidine kinase [Mycoplasmopsis felis]MCU9931515.1 thymidine kinase [Mycoplasmopsis felis]WQQ03673.1 thymidine kinase [Mycoplasmopsis felis]WQQ09442.1 thymidine kinase [Mycoplasmopsis felis]WQQ11600.1 thymidine kinase [Mycoplasmopsis felis]